MVERFPGDGAAANGFGRRHLHEDEARLLFEVEYPVPPDMRVPGAWRISVGGVPVPPPPPGAARRAEIARIRASLPRAAREGPRYVPDSPLWEPYFRRRHAEQPEATNGIVPSGRLNSEGRRRWWGVPGRTLEAVLEYIEGGNTPRLEYPAPPSFSRRRGSSWTPRHTEVSSSLSGRSTVSTCLHPVKPEPQDTPVSVRTRSSGVRIGDSTPPSGRFVLVEPKPEPGLPAEYEEIARGGFSDEDALRWARDDYLRDEMVRQRRALEEIAARRRGREDEHDVVILDSDDDEDAPGPSNPLRQPGNGCSRDGGHGGDDEDNGGGDYTQFYSLLGM